jgi:hypothetical protein
MSKNMVLSWAQSLGRGFLLHDNMAEDITWRVRAVW